MTASFASKGAAEGRGEDRRASRASSRVPMPNPDESVADLVERVCRAWGGAKALAGGPLDVGYPQIRRWACDGSVPNLRQILRLCELAGPDDPFRRELIDALTNLFQPQPEEVARAVERRLSSRSAVTPREAAETVRQVLLFPEEELPLRRTSPAKRALR